MILWAGLHLGHLVGVNFVGVGELRPCHSSAWLDMGRCAVSGSKSGSCYRFHLREVDVGQNIIQIKAAEQIGRPSDYRAL